VVIAYTDLAASLVRSKERCAGYATDTDNQLLTELLQLSAGLNIQDVTHYRPYLVAALFLEQSPQVQSLKEADGVVFSQLKDAIASLRNLQSAYDSSHNLTVPSGFEAGTKRSPLPFTSSSVPLKVIP